MRIVGHSAKYRREQAARDRQAVGTDLVRRIGQRALNALVLILAIVVVGGLLFGALAMLAIAPGTH